MRYLSLRKSLMVALLITSLQSFSQSLTPMVIGTIHPNDSVVIYYDVTIGAGAGSQISNQGTVTGTGINMLTDDPDTGPANDPTITPLNMFPLPVSLMDVKAALKGAAIEVAWNVASETGMVKYEIEKSSNGRSFTKIGEVAALNRSMVTPYSFLDGNPLAGANYYRLKLIDGSISTRYSAIVRVDMDAKGYEIKIYPNPVVQQNITVQLSNLQKGTYQLVFYNNLGQIAYRRTINHEGGSVIRNILLPQNLTRGIYAVQLRSDKQLFNQLIMVN